jgi:RNA polymerase sigma-70 factor, ECF subfamily
MAALTKLLRDDAVLEMPPMLTWFAGRDQVIGFLAAQVLHHPGQFTMIPISANGQPAFAEYLRGHDGIRRAFGIQVITATATGIAHIVVFVNQPELFPLFGLPPALPQPSSPRGTPDDRH